MDKTLTKYPFFSLFLRLRNRGLMIHLEDYYDLLRALQAGFGITSISSESEDQLKAFSRLCKLLWVSTTEEANLFDQQFALYLKEKSLAFTQEGKQEKTKPEGTIRDDRKTDLGDQLEDESTSTPEPASDQPNNPLEIPTPRVETTRIQNPYSPTHQQFLISKQYLPLKHREVQQCWRHLYRPERTGFGDLLDVPQTVTAFARKGYLEKPLFLAEYSNQVQLYLLIDSGGSMIAFDQISKLIVQSAREGGKVQDVHDFYFRNIPRNRIYTDPKRTNWMDIDKFFGKLDARRSSVLILSDAGAARGARNLRRLYETEAFLEDLYQKSLRIAWLNPMPRYRWKNSSAERIAKQVAMFPLDRFGLEQAIEVLKGKVF